MHYKYIIYMCVCVRVLLQNTKHKTSYFLKGSFRYLHKFLMANNKNR